MKMNIVFCEIGLEIVNSNLAKELARFLNYYEKEDISTNLLLFEHKTIKKRDLETQPYLEEDIGFKKAGVLASVLKETFPKLSVKGIETMVAKELMVKQIHQTFHRNACKDIACFIIDTSDVRSNNIAISLFYQEENAIYIAASKKRISVGFRLNGNTIKEPVQIQTRITNFLTALTAVHLIMAKISNFLANGKLTLKSLMLTNYLTAKSDGGKRRIKQPKNLIIVCVGAGGTGGCFYKELIRYTNQWKNENVSFSIVLIDGDIVEEKNQKRQPFFKEDIQQKKAIVLYNIASDVISKKHHLFAYPYYLDTVSDLYEAVKPAYCDDMSNEVYLIGAVDNHKARQVLHKYFAESNTLVYIDSANEYSEGEIVISRKQDGIVIAPPRAFYFPDVLTDQSLAASELSCGTLNMTEPQHMVTNLMAGHMTLRCLDQELRYKENRGGILYFDALECFARYQSIPKEVEKCNLKHY